MLHIKNSSNSPPLASTMCTRRHKGMLQTSIILVLFVCIGYGFYLYNLLQVRIKYLDSKALRHQSQQQSLSSQLQAVYEDRAKLEKAVQKSKTELQKTKDEKEAAIQEMLLEHQDKNDALAKENTELKSKNKALGVEKHDLKQKFEKVSREHDELNKRHQSHLNEHASQIGDAQAEVEMYQRNNLNLQREKEDMEAQVRQSNERYEEIKHALNAIPANAVNFNHPVVAKLPFDSKQLLKNHLGEADDFQPQQVVDASKQRENNGVLMQQHPQGDGGQPQYQAQQQQENDARIQEYEARRREYEAQQQNQQVVQQNADQHNVINSFDPQHPAAGFPNQDHVSPEMRAQNVAPVAQTIDICALDVDPGPCHDPGKMRFAYFPQLQQCRAFTYGGCGGNQNNFESIEQCTEICNDPRRRYVEVSLTEEQQVQEMLDQGVLDNDDNIQHVVGKPVEDVEEKRDYGLDEEQRRQVLEQERNAKREEEEARRELQEQDQNMNGAQDGNGDEDPLKELKENSIKQLEVAKNQQADMQKLLEQQQKDDDMQPDGVVDTVEARIEDEGGDPGDEDDDTNQDNQEEDDADEEEEENGNDGELELADSRSREEDAQFDMPPAAKIAGHDPEAVMDAPPADRGIDSKDINGQDIYEQERQEEDNMDDRDQPLEYRGDNQQDEGGEEEEEGEEEEDDDFNQDDPRDGGFGQDDNGRPDFEDPDQGNEDENDEDNYANEEEDSKEKELRESRENQRILRDRQFKARREVQDMIPPNANLRRNREM